MVYISSTLGNCSESYIAISNLIAILNLLHPFIWDTNAMQWLYLMQWVHLALWPPVTLYSRLKSSPSWGACRSTEIIFSRGELRFINTLGPCWEVIYKFYISRFELYTTCIQSSCKSRVLNSVLRKIKNEKNFVNFIDKSRYIYSNHLGDKNNNTSGKERPL